MAFTRFVASRYVFAGFGATEGAGVSHLKSGGAGVAVTFATALLTFAAALALPLGMLGWFASTGCAVATFAGVELWAGGLPGASPPPPPHEANRSVGAN